MLYRVIRELGISHREEGTRKVYIVRVSTGLLLLNPIKEGTVANFPGDRSGAYVSPHPP
jgi:hypothetical protein